MEDKIISVKMINKKWTDVTSLRDSFNGNRVYKAVCPKCDNIIYGHYEGKEESEIESLLPDSCPECKAKMI